MIKIYKRSLKVAIKKIAKQNIKKKLLQIKQLLSENNNYLCNHFHFY